MKAVCQMNLLFYSKGQVHWRERKRERQSEKELDCDGRHLHVIRESMTLL